MIDKKTKDNIIASSVGAIAAELLTIPICTLRTNYQTKINYEYSTLNYIKEIYKRNGIKSFYNATWASSCSQISSLTIKYTTYENIKRMRNKNKEFPINNFVENCSISILSSWCASIFHHPFDVARIHTQRGDKIREHISKHGIIKVFKAGYGGTLIRNTLTSIIFPLYDMYKDLLKKNNINNMILAPILTSATSTILLYPLDYIRNRQMSNLEWNHGWNLTKYYRGITFGLCRNTLHFSVFCYGAEYVKRTWLSL